MSFILILCLVKFIPEWFPGAGWKKKGNAWRRHLMRFVNEPFEVAKDMIVSQDYLEDYKLLRNHR